MSKVEYKNVHNKTYKPQREGTGRPRLCEGVSPPQHDCASLLPMAEKLPGTETSVFPISMAHLIRSNIAAL